MVTLSYLDGLLTQNQDLADLTNHFTLGCQNQTQHKQQNSDGALTVWHRVI